MCLYVRSLTLSEGQRLQLILRRSKSRTLVRRAMVFLLSDQGMRVQEIAQSTLLSEEYIRELLRRFNSGDHRGLFTPPRHPGRPPLFTEEVKAEIAEVAKAPPGLLRQPFTRLESGETLQLPEKEPGGQLHQPGGAAPDSGGEEGPSLAHQDLERIDRGRSFERKKNGSKGSTRGGQRGRRSSVSTRRGPLEVRPRHGLAWAQTEHVPRLRATYTRPHGVRHFLSFYDIHEDVLYGYFF